MLNVINPFKILVVLLFALAVNSAFAQSISLTPQQRAMLNQLPPAQRAQALQAIRQMNGAQSGGGQLSSLSEADVEDGEALQSLMDVQGALLPEVVLRVEGATDLVLDISRSEGLTNDETTLVENDLALIDIEGSGFFQTNSSGTLELPGLGRFSLLGLDEEQIRVRLMAEPVFKFHEIQVVILESQLSGADALERFGLNVFGEDTADVSLTPTVTGPVPEDYILGPGDNVRVQLYGNLNEIYEYEVTRDGVLSLPQLGPVTVAGLSFSALRSEITSRVEETLIGTQASVTLGQLRQIRVFVLGDVNQPGSYAVSSLSTISSALIDAGGVGEIGSLRNVQLKRGGRTLVTLDLYDFLLRGDSSDDRRLRNGDVVFIPPVQGEVSVLGAVRRPAIYELAGAESVNDIVSMAGGFASDADRDSINIQRVDGLQRKVITTAVIAGVAPIEVVPGDVIAVDNVLPEMHQVVTVNGHTFRDGQQQWKPGLRLTDLFPSVDFLKPGADTGYVLIKRESGLDKKISVLSSSLLTAWESPSSNDDIELKPRDTIFVFDRSFDRQRILDPIMEELKLQSSIDHPYAEVSVTGEVLSPGAYPLEQSMTVRDLLRAGGELTEAAYANSAELVRYQVVNGESREAEVISVDLAAILDGDTSADVMLRSHDVLRVGGLPDWESLWSVTLDGEVRFPGSYRIQRGETLAQLIARAGGLTEYAFPEGAVFLRESLKEREQEQIEILAQRLEADLTSLSLQEGSDTSAETMTTGRNLLSQLRSTDATGRLVINLQQIIDNPTSDLELRADDRLLIPSVAQEVTVIGEVQQSTSHLYEQGLSRADYIAMSGGLTRRADKKLIYIVRANGAVISENRSRWFARNDVSLVRPGDTIVVPLETDRIRPLTLWSSVTQILYQGAIAVAAVRTFNN